MSTVTCLVLLDSVSGRLFVQELYREAAGVGCVEGTGDVKTVDLVVTTGQSQKRGCGSAVLVHRGLIRQGQLVVLDL